MTVSKKSAEGFVKALDKFAFRLMIYFSIVLLVGFVAFIAELIVEPHSHVLLKHAMAEGFVTGLTVVTGLCLVELFLYWGRRYTRQLEAEARKAGNTLTTICHSIPDLVYVKDVEGRHLMVNKAVEEFTGQPAHHLLGKSMADLLPPDLAASCMKSDREPIVTGKPCHVEEHFSNASGSRTLDTIKTPLRDDRGTIIGIVGISRDITEKLKAEEERRQLQAQLLHAQKMESLGHLAGGIAHDFNNILTAIMGFTEILQVEHANDESLVHQTDQILGASLRAKKLIKGLFAFSSKQEIDMRPVDLNSIVSGGRKLLQHMINARVSVGMNCCSRPLTIMGDQFQLERVLMNLATNAQDAMPHGGDLVFSTDFFEMGDDFIKKHGYGVRGNYGHLAVSDTGTGISEEHIKKIFEPLFTTKEKGKGTGLGLAIVYGIVKQHNGFINLSSEPGHGTTFHVYLPLTGSV